MFAYCKNDPANRVDYLGERSVAYKGDLTGYGGGGSAGLLDLIISTWVTTTTVIDTYRNSIKVKAEAKAETTYQPDKHEHHIVPRTAKKAAPARAIITEIYPEMGVEAPINKVLLDTKMHHYVHTNLYYGMVNYVMLTAYYSPAENKLQQEQNVNTALIFLRGLLLVIEKTV